MPRLQNVQHIDVRMSHTFMMGFLGKGKSLSKQIYRIAKLICEWDFFFFFLLSENFAAKRHRPEQSLFCMLMSNF